MPKRSLFRRKSVSHIMREADYANTIGGATHGLKRNLGVRDLVLLGIAAIIGAGLFSTIGEAAAAGGPAVSLLFVFTAVACGFAALCYAEFSSAIPVSGSAYTYAYASFGELLAWIIGWDLIVEYAVGNIAVAISWSDYFTSFMAGLGLDIPLWMTMDYMTASQMHEAVVLLMQGASDTAAHLVEAFKANPTLDNLKALSANPADITMRTLEGWKTWNSAPTLGGLHIIADIPAFLVVVFITVLVFVGIKESKNFSNILVFIKLLVIALVIGLGFYYTETDNWVPFAPNGFGGVMSGVAAVFFAYIGFDALSTMSEETKDPQRVMPRAMILTLVVCTVIYIIIALALTGLVPYQELAVGDPLALAIEYTGLPPVAMNWIKGIVAGGAIVATTTVLLVFQLGQPRILMSMSRDGLLPRPFARIHTRFRTPGFSTVVTGIFVALPCLFTNLEEMTDLTSIGTLFAFVLVCGGVLVQQLTTDDDYQPKFRVPYISGRFTLPLLTIGLVWLIYYFDVANPDTAGNLGYAKLFSFQLPFFDSFPMWLFIIVVLGLNVGGIVWRFSLLPSLGLALCFYLMAQVEPASWIRFGGWLALGLIIYFLYGRKHSRLNVEE
ncbi:MAG: amino acid permease [Bacteroidota bacterium]